MPARHALDLDGDALAAGQVGTGVELLQWPRDQELRDRLARDGIPRLLLVAADAPPPDVVGIDEDWVRLPADERDVATRLQRLARIVAQLGHERPVVDRNRILHRGGAAVVLSAAEAAVVSLLIGSVGSIVDRTVFERALWPDGGPPSAKAVDAVVYRLRRRLAGLNLCIRSARGRGFVIYLDEPGD